MFHRGDKVKTLKEITVWGEKIPVGTVMEVVYHHTLKERVTVESVDLVWIDSEGNEEECWLFPKDLELFRR